MSAAGLDFSVCNPLCTGLLWGIGQCGVQRTVTTLGVQSLQPPVYRAVVVHWLVWCATHGYNPLCTVFATPCVQGCFEALVSVVCNTRLLPAVYSVCNPPCVQGCCGTLVSAVCNTRLPPFVYSVLQPPVNRAVVVHWLVWCATHDYYPLCTVFYNPLCTGLWWYTG